jgi:hypothetical protein
MGAAVVREVEVMNRDAALRLLRGGPEGIAEWNRRRSAGDEVPNLCEADLGGVDLTGANLSRANLYEANLTGANLSRAQLIGADLYGADLTAAQLIGADLTEAYLRQVPLTRADLTGAQLAGADLREADLDRADLTGADLTGANFGAASLRETDLDGARCSGTIFADIDLSEVRGLDEVKHRGPSEISVSTLFRSRGQIPEAFLRGCGVPDPVIVNLPALIGAMEPIQFSSCFISYSPKDEAFAQRLHARMVQEKLRVWFAPEDIRAVRKLPGPIDQAIRVYDKLLLVLSLNSLTSAWVKTEIRKAREIELTEGPRKLFPIRLVDFEVIRDWECFDADSGQDMGVAVREYFIPDFTNWKDHDAFEASFARLLRDLKAEDSTAQ